MQLITVSFPVLLELFINLLIMKKKKTIYDLNYINLLYFKYII